ERERGFYGSEFEIQLKNKLTQRAIAKECAEWMRRKATFRSNRGKAPMQQFICLQGDADRAVYLINYDIHWNPVRIIQRFGRIDRIGSRNESVQLVNFWPTDDLNKYINLKNRVEARMALVDLSATFEDNVLKNEEIEDIISEDLRYRDKQLLRLKDEV